MRKHGGTPSRPDKHVMLAAISPPGVARGRFVGGHQSGLAGCKLPPLFMRGASSCPSQGRRQGEPWGASPGPSAPTYLPQLRLHIHHIQRLKNELSDYLSRINFDERLQVKSEGLSKEAFQRKDTQLDLSLEEHELLSVINPKDYGEECNDVLDKLGEAKYAIIEDVLWIVGSNGLLRNEIRTCVPAQYLNNILLWMHDVEGDPESRSWLCAFNRFFYTREEDAKMLESISRLQGTCEACLHAKTNWPKDRGLVGCLALPDLVNSLVYVDFIDRHSYGQFDYCLMNVDSLSSFCQVVPCRKKNGGEQVLSLVHQHSIKHYGAMVRLHSDGDIWFTSKTGWWRNTFKAMGVEVTFGQPYSPQ